MKNCYIFGSAEGLPKKFEINKDDLLIAADAGYLSLKRLGFKPHLAVGDFDSLKVVPTDTEVIKHPSKKDDTDTLLAVKIGLSRGYDTFFLYGCAGGRLDHTLANMQTLSYITNNGARGFLYGADFVATAVTKGEIVFSEKEKGNISVFSATTNCEISISGLLYELEKTKITYDFPLGVSNEFIGKKAKITVHKGTAIIVKDNKIFI
ncbi:MAG: thiamine diphosphokinase [Clostridia bacterium]|nr:thiamine diphosphokinase [Clostridia bacterium]